MNNLFRGALAGAAAWKLGGGLYLNDLYICIGFLASRKMLNEYLQQQMKGGRFQRSAFLYFSGPDYRSELVYLSGWGVLRSLAGIRRFFVLC